MGPCHFLPEHLFYLSHRKICWTMSVDIVGLKNVFWGFRTPWSLSHVFLGVNQHGPMTNSTTNHIFYKAMGRLHGPWFHLLLL